MASGKGISKDPNHGHGGSETDHFVQIELDDRIRGVYRLPKQLLPVRISVLENSNIDENIQFNVLADECMAYCRKYPEKIIGFKDLLAKLCYLAGLGAGKHGNHLIALKYLSEAYANNPYDIDIASNCALALGKTI